MEATNDQVGFDTQISQELFAFDEVKTKVSELISKAEAFFNSKDTKFLVDKEGYFLPNKIKLKTIPLRDYSDLRNLKIAVPPGLKASYKEYGESLLDGAIMSTKIKDNVLTPYARWLSSNINDPKNLMSGRGGDIKDFEPTDIESFYLTTGKLFTKGSNLNEGKYGDYFSRNKELVEVGELNIEIAAQLAKIDRKEILNKVNELTYYLDKLYDTVKDMEGNQVSSTTGKILSTMTYTVAREVEFMGMVFYNFRAYNQAFEATIKKM